MKYHVQVLKFGKEYSNFKGLINLGSHTFQEVVELFKKDFNQDLPVTLSTTDGSFVSFFVENCEVYGKENSLDVLVTSICA
jgi:hypothetical protein